MSFGLSIIPTALTHLAVQEQVAASTQNQAFSAVLFLYRQVLEIQFEQPIQALRARELRYLPTVLTPEEVRAIIECLAGTYQLVVQLLYGSGLRQREALTLRVKDVDFGQRQLEIRDVKGRECRVTMLPNRLIQPLQVHLQSIRQQHQQDLAHGYGAVYLPYALERKYPNAEREWQWQFVFSSDRLSRDPRSPVTRRHHLHESGLQRAIKQAVRQAKVSKRVSCHTFRHSFARIYSKMAMTSA
jgi:integron integrase